MLDECAPGWVKETKAHHYWVMWKDRTFPSLPKGQHGKKKGRAMIEVGHIKQMIRQLTIDMDCAQKHLPVLR